VLNPSKKKKSSRNQYEKKIIHTHIQVAQEVTSKKFQKIKYKNISIPIFPIAKKNIHPSKLPASNLHCTSSHGVSK